MTGRIVVGVDGSEESRRALRWAVEEARFRGASLEALYVYEHNPSWRLYGYGEDMVAVADVSAVREQVARDEELARRRALALVEDAVAQIAEPEDVRIEPHAVQDRRPARALVDQSADADMLVLGSRGRGGFAGLLLGSVTQQCAHHARCPLVIISHRSREKTGI